MAAKSEVSVKVTIGEIIYLNAHIRATGWCSE